MRAAPLALVLAACTATGPQAPAPRGVFPSQGDETAATPIEIGGAHFAPAARTDFNEGAGARLDSRFAVRLSPAVGGADVDLTEVSFVSERQLDAVVPAGLPLGLYHLTVVGPDGRSGTLLDAFRVVRSADNVVAFRFGPIEPQRAGVPFFVAMTAVDEAGRAVEGFDGSVSLSDATGTALPATVGPFTLGRGGAWVTVSALRTADALAVTDALGHTGASDPFDVGPGPVVAIAFASAPVSVAPGACSPAIEIETRDRFGNPSVPEAALEVRLEAAPPDGLTFHGESGCSGATDRASVPAGATRGAFHFRSGEAGSVTIRAVPATLPSASQTETVSL